MFSVLLDDLKARYNQLCNLYETLKSDHQNCKLRWAEEFQRKNYKLLSANQMKLMTQDAKKVRWTSEDLSKAFAIRYTGIQPYKVMKLFGYPLPDISTLNELSSKLDISPGIFHKVLAVMKPILLELPEIHRITVLSFDETAVDSRIEFDKRHEMIVGPHKKAQVVHARALFSEWKQIIYTDFDVAMLQDLFHLLISAMHAAGAIVRAFSFDNATQNWALLKSLKVINFC